MAQRYLRGAPVKRGRPEGRGGRVLAPAAPQTVFVTPPVTDAFVGVRGLGAIGLRFYPTTA